jgi:hypothetical protein
MPATDYAGDILLTREEFLGISTFSAGIEIDPWALGTGVTNSSAGQSRR